MTVETGRFAALAAVPPNTTVSVHPHGSQALATLYTDKSSGTTAPNPIQDDGFGNIQFYAVAGDYDLVFPSHRITVTVWPDPSNAWTGS